MKQTTKSKGAPKNALKQERVYECCNWSQTVWGGVEGCAEEGMHGKPQGRSMVKRGSVGGASIYQCPNCRDIIIVDTV